MWGFCTLGDQNNLQGGVLCIELIERKDRCHTNTGKMFGSEETAREGPKCLRISKDKSKLEKWEWKKNSQGLIN